MATTTIDFNKITKKTHSFNLKKFDTVNLTNFANNDFSSSVSSVSASGNTLTIKLTNDKIIKLSGITDPNTITFTGAYNKTLQQFYDEKFNGSWLPTKGTKVTGSVFDENIDVHDYVNLKNKGLTINANGGADSIVGTDYADVINGGIGGDIIEGGSGNDKLTGGKDGDTFVFKSADGVDTITDAEAADVIQITDTSAANLQFVKNKNNLEIYYSNALDPNNKIVVQNYFSKKEALRIDNVIASGTPLKISEQPITIKGKGALTGTTFNDRILGESTADTIKGMAGNDEITGNGGNDKLYGGEGNNTFIFKAGDGIDTVFANGGNDTLKFNNFATINDLKAGVTLLKDKNNLKISYSDSDTVIVDKYYTNKINSVKTIQAADGNTISLEQLMTELPVAITGTGKIEGDDNANIIEGSDKADTILANGGNDVINGGNGNDIITGGKGNDIINGDLGKNTYKFAVGDGNDTVISGGGTDTLVFDKGVNVSVEYVDNDLVVSYGTEGDTVILKDYNEEHSVKYIQVGSSKKTIDKYFPEPEKLLINGVNLVQGTDNADNITVNTEGTNRIFAGAGNDTIKTGGNSWTTNFVYAGEGNDVITSGVGTDIIYGGGGENKIYLGKGSGADCTYDEADNTFVFKNISNLNKLILTGGPQDILGTVADLTISGYGNTGDSLTIKNFFNLEGYDFSEIKVQAGENGIPVSLYDLVNESDLAKTYFTGTYKPTPKSITTSPAQKAPQIDSIIYGNTPGFSSHNYLLGTAGGNNTFYSGGVNEGLMGHANGGNTYIIGGDGDETVHAEGNKIYYDGQTYENREYLIVVNKQDGTKEIKNGVFYNTALADEEPYTKYVDSFGDSYDIYYTEDSNKISQIREHDYEIKRGFLSDNSNNIAFVEYIKSSTGSIDGGGGNDTFYTSSGANGGDGNDTVKGSGVMYGNRGDDKFIVTDEYDMNSELAPMYYVNTNSGNDYIDTTQMSSDTDARISVVFGEGVNTLVVDGSREIDIAIGSTSTFREEEPVSKFIETKDLGTDSNDHFTAFEKDGKFYIASKNSKGAGTLIIDGWGELSDEQKDKITITYKESHEWVHGENSTYTLREFMNVINQEGELFEGEGYTNGAHKYDMGGGITVRKKETYTFHTIDNSNGEAQTINEDGQTVKANRNIYDANQEITGTVEKNVDYYIIGGTGSQTINGGDGNDVIYGDNLNGHNDDGNYIYSTNNDGADTIHGGKGDDYIIGGAGNDFIDGGSGKDYIDGGNGNDTLIGGTTEASDLENTNFNYKEIHGREGNDTIYSMGAYTDGAFDAEKAKAYQGGDTYFTNNIYAGDGNDTIHANGYRDVVYGGKGNDTIYSYVESIDPFYNSDATSEIFGEEGNDHIILKSKADVRVFGGDGDDIIDARDSQVVYYNMLWGGKGNDTIYGGEGEDIIYTGYGNNHVEAGGGDDEIYGSEEWLGRGDDNYIDAGAGNDYIRTSGTSTVLGGDGNDTIYIATGYRNVPSNLYIDGGDGDDTYIADGGYGFDTIVASEGNDVIQFMDFRKADTSYQYQGNDLVLSYTNEGYPAGLILKDYKLGGFANFTVKTYGGFNEEHIQNGQYKMADFISYLDGNYSMAADGTAGADKISSTETINALGGDDFIIACSTSSTAENPQIVNTGSGNNEILATSGYTSITGGNGNDNYVLRGIMSTVVDAGGNNTVIIEQQPSRDNLFYDITLNGKGDNTVTSLTDEYAVYKITAEGTGKQTIDLNSAEYRNLYDTDEQVFTQINTGSGDDNISLYMGTVESGAGNDIITVKNGAGSGSYSTTCTNVLGGEGNDSYIIQGGYDWLGETGKSVNTKVLITDANGSNNIMFTSEFMTHDSLHLLLNIKADGTLAQFTHYEYNFNTGENDIVGTGYSAFVACDMNFKDAGTVSTASNNGWDICDGVKIADTATLNNLSKIEASDGYYVSQSTLSTIKANVVGWLTENGYGSVMDAIKPEGQNDFNTDNYNTLYAMFNNENTWTPGA